MTMVVFPVGDGNEYRLGVGHDKLASDEGHIPRRGWKPTSKGLVFSLICVVTKVIFPVGDGNGVGCGHRIQETEARS